MIYIYKSKFLSSSHNFNISDPSQYHEGAKCSMFLVLPCEKLTCANETVSGPLLGAVGRELYSEGGIHLLAPQLAQKRCHFSSVFKRCDCKTCQSLQFWTIFLKKKHAQLISKISYTPQ